MLARNPASSIFSRWKLLTTVKCMTAMTELVSLLQLHNTIFCFQFSILQIRPELPKGTRFMDYPEFALHIDVTYTCIFCHFSFFAIQYIMKRKHLKSQSELGDQSSTKCYWLVRFDVEIYVTYFFKEFAVFLSASISSMLAFAMIVFFC